MPFSLSVRLALVCLPALVAACGGEETSATSEANLDTSGCTGLERTTSQGPVVVSAAQPPTKSCWNIGTSGLTESYAWTQSNNAEPTNTNIGFWTSINGVGSFAKASSYRCEPIAHFGMGHDTSGNQDFRCTATARFDFQRFPTLLDASYRQDGSRLPWGIEVAVSLDDENHWDSLEGKNYRFDF